MKRKAAGGIFGGMPAAGEKSEQPGKVRQISDFCIAFAGRILYSLDI